MEQLADDLRAQRADRSHSGNTPSSLLLNAVISRASSWTSKHSTADPFQSTESGARQIEHELQSFVDINLCEVAFAGSQFEGHSLAAAGGEEAYGSANVYTSGHVDEASSEILAGPETLTGAINPAADIAIGALTPVTNVNAPSGPWEQYFDQIYQILENYPADDYETAVAPFHKHARFVVKSVGDVIQNSDFISVYRSEGSTASRMAAVASISSDGMLLESPPTGNVIYAAVEYAADFNVFFLHERSKSL